MTSHLHDNSTRFEIRSRYFMYVDNIVNDVIDDVTILRIPGVSQILNSCKFINIWAEASNRGRNVEILIGYFGIIPNCRYSLLYNTHLNGPQDSSHLKFRNISYSFSLTSNIRKDHYISSRTFWCWWRQRWRHMDTLNLAF